jgi:hypothetical protein
MPSERFGPTLDGYDIVEDIDSIEVRCAAGGALRAAAEIRDGEVTHVAVEHSPYGSQAFGILSSLIALRLGR